MTIPAPTASTRLIALLGDPVSHSLSPAFQNAGMRAAGLDGVYVALRCGPGDVGTLIRGIARAGGAGNVTLPHKESAARAPDEITEAVEMTGAANTFWMEKGVIWGDNTDVAGVAAAVRAVVRGSPRGIRVLLLGAGGAARATLLALREVGAEHVLMINRTPARARNLADRFATHRYTVDVAFPDDNLAGRTFDLAVNATALGFRPGDAQPNTQNARVGAVLDLVYAPGETPWVREARARGLSAADGREMLLHQGAASFRRWWGAEPPLEAMRAALEEAARPPAGAVAGA